MLQLGLGSGPWSLSYSAQHFCALSAGQEKRVLPLVTGPRTELRGLFATQRPCSSALAKGDLSSELPQPTRFPETQVRLWGTQMLLSAPWGPGALSTEHRALSMEQSHLVHCHSHPSGQNSVTWPRPLARETGCPPGRGNGPW